MCSCTSGNLEIPGLVLTHHPGMTTRQFPTHKKKNARSPRVFVSQKKTSGVVTPPACAWCQKPTLIRGSP